MTRRIALLRGINVGGHRKVPMKDLRDSLAGLGAGNVASVVQSGNLAFDTDLDETATDALVRAAIKSCSGLSDVPVVLREPHEIAAVITSVGEAVSPGAGASAATSTTDSVALPTEDPKKLHVVFTAHRDTPGAMVRSEVEALSDLIAPDVFGIAGSHIVLHTPDGLGRSKAELPRWERLTGDHCTMRNWTTVSKLVEL